MNEILQSPVVEAQHCVRNIISILLVYQRRLPEKLVSDRKYDFLTQLAEKLKNLNYCLDFFPEPDRLKLQIFMRSIVEIEDPITLDSINKLIKYYDTEGIDDSVQHASQKLVTA